MHITLSEIAAALAITRQGAAKRAKKEAWSYIEAPARGGRQYLYPVWKLPRDAQAALAAHLARRSFSWETHQPPEGF
jgi:hypothetical protein